MLSSAKLRSFVFLQVRKNQQRMLMILDGSKIPYQLIDITAPGSERELDFLKEHGKRRSEKAAPVPPQVFFDEELLGVSAIKVHNRNAELSGTAIIIPLFHFSLASLPKTLSLLFVSLFSRFFLAHRMLWTLIMPLKWTNY
jgi:SH3-binding, glutamic acid-rich protein